MELGFKKSKKVEELAEKIKLNRAQQMSLAFVSVTSLIIGAGVVVGIWFIRYIDFNTKVLITMDNSISNYSKAVSNSGACPASASKDGIYSNKELDECEPDSVNVESVPESLKYNVLMNMSSNVNLESVGRSSASICYDASMNKYTQSQLLKKYQNAADLDEKTDWLQTMVMCSSLRTIPDALPTAANENMAIISLNKIYNDSGYAFSGYSSSLGGIGGESEGMEEITLGTIPMTISITQETGQDGLALKVLRNLEKSIRTFDMSTAAVSWVGGNNGSISIKAPASLYYSSPTELKEVETEVTVKTKIAEEE